MRFEKQEEEAAIEVENVRFLTFQEDIYPDLGTHYVTFYFIADWKSGELVPQPEEFERFEWFDWNDLPEPLFRPTKRFLEADVNPLD